MLNYSWDFFHKNNHQLCQSSSGTLTLHICRQESLWLGAWGQRSSQVTNMVLDSEGWKNNTKDEKQREVSAGNMDRDKVDTITGDLRRALTATGSKCRLEYEQHIYMELHIQAADNRHFVEANILQNTRRTDRYDPLTHQWEVIWIFRNCRGVPVNNTRTFENKLTLQQVSQSVKHIVPFKCVLHDQQIHTILNKGILIVWTSFVYCNIVQ